MAFRRALVVQKNVCDECGQTLDEKELKTHFHAVQKLSSDDYLLVLPDNVAPGTIEAARYLAKAKKELQDKSPGKTFQYVPFGFQNVQNSQNYDFNLFAILAFSQPTQGE